MGDEFSKFGEWEKAWQEALDGSELTPPAKVWSGLENSLMEQQLLRYKHKLVVYQWLAAASVLLLGFWAGWWLLFEQAVDPNKQAGTYTAKESAPAVEIAHEQDYTGSTAVFNWFAEALQAKTEDQAATSAAGDASQTEPTVPSQSLSASKEADEQGISPLSGHYPFMQQSFLRAAKIQGMLLDIMYTSKVSRSTSPEELAGTIQDDAANRPDAASRLDVLYPADSAVAAIEALLALKNGEVHADLHAVPASVKKIKKKPVLPNGSIWLGGSLASHLFDPNLGGNSTNSLAWTNEPAPAKGNYVYSASESDWNAKENSLPSINFSVDAAFRVGQRWVMQGSLAYGAYRVGTLSGTYTDRNSNQSYPLYYTNFSVEKVQMVNQNSRKALPVNALNTYRFLSVPLVLNYVLFEQKIGLSLGGGISTDIFLGGQIMDQERRLQPYSLETGPDSPFNRINFHSIVGAQLFYRAGANHLFTIEPSYKYALNNLNKSNSVFQSRPSQFGVAVGFRYILY